MKAIKEILIMCVLVLSIVWFLVLITGVTSDSLIRDNRPIKIKDKYYRCYEKKVEE